MLEIVFDEHDITLIVTQVLFSVLNGLAVTLLIILWMGNPGFIKKEAEPQPRPQFKVLLIS